MKSVILFLLLMSGAILYGVPPASPTLTQPQKVNNQDTEDGEDEGDEEADGDEEDEDVILMEEDVDEEDQGEHEADYN